MGLDKGDVALDGITTFSALMASLFGALYPSEGYVNALFFSFLLTIFSTPVHGFLHYRSGADMRYVIACNICLLLQGPIMLFIRNPIGPWALLIFLITPALSIPASKLRRPEVTSTRPSPPPRPRVVSSSSGPPPSRRPRRRRPRRGRRGRRRRRPRRSP